MGFRESMVNCSKRCAGGRCGLRCRYFRADELRVERKGDGTAVTQAIAPWKKWHGRKVAASGWRWTFWGKRWGGGDAKSGALRGERA